MFSTLKHFYVLNSYLLRHSSNKLSVKSRETNLFRSRSISNHFWQLFYFWTMTWLMPRRPTSAWLVVGTARASAVTGIWFLVSAKLAGPAIRDGKPITGWWYHHKTFVCAIDGDWLATVFNVAVKISYLIHSLVASFWTSVDRALPNFLSHKNPWKKHSIMNLEHKIAHFNLSSTDLILSSMDWARSVRVPIFIVVVMPDHSNLTNKFKK